MYGQCSAGARRRTRTKNGSFILIVIAVLVLFSTAPELRSQTTPNPIGDAESAKVSTNPRTSQNAARVGTNSDAVATNSDATAPAAPPASVEEVRRFEQRLVALESERHDLSTWATIFIGSISLLALANVGLSVWQVGSIARHEVGKAVTDYDQRFSGFLVQEQGTIEKRLAEFDTALSELAKKRASLSLLVDEYSGAAEVAVGEIRKIGADTLLRLQQEGQRIRNDLRSELSRRDER